MISSQRTQNVIVSFFIIIALVSSVFLVNNALYYSGSYELAGRMEVSLVKTVVSDIDPTNESLDPRLVFTLNFRTEASREGNVRLIVIGLTAWLNDDSLSYSYFQRGVTASSDQLLHPGYNVNFTLARTIDSDADRNTILQADNTDTWNWYVRVSYDFITFDDSRSRTSRILYLNSTGSIIIL
jgi:hypothetical protein